MPEEQTHQETMNGAAPESPGAEAVSVTNGPAQKADNPPQNVPDATSKPAVVLRTSGYSYDEDDKVIEGQIQKWRLMAVSNSLLSITSENIVTFELSDDAVACDQCPVMDLDESDVRLNNHFWSVSFRAQNVEPETVDEVQKAQCFSVEGDIIRAKLVKAGLAPPDGDAEETRIQIALDKGSLKIHDNLMGP